jgi:predicted metalloenzyme YecM
MIPQQQLANNEEINEIKTTTNQLTNDMRDMKKLIEDLQMSLSEKDAEIIKLNMHLGDEKKRY